ncbi:MAG TPA: peptidylprolyl isomerase [Polyangium sp.]|nr:peptidylprolyl isomerase [Polyangium sp.]
MRLRSFFLAGGLVALGAFCPRPAEAIVVERIVAVVGDDPILLSELRGRAKPFLIQIQQRVRPGAEQAAAESEVFKDMLSKMIDEKLEAQAAVRAGVTVTNEEIDNAIRNVAANQGMSVAELLKSAKLRSGMPEQDYRDEIRRQILEGKMLQLRVRGRVRITEDDVRTMYDRMVREERRQREYHPSWIVLQIMPGASGAVVAERKKLAAELVTRAREGEDFAMLAQAYSDEVATRDQGGDLGIRTPQGSNAAKSGQLQVLAPEFENVVMGLEPGQVSDPVVIDRGIVIFKLQTRRASRFKGYEEHKEEMVQRLQTEILEKAKRKWLEELNRRTRVEQRL